MYHSRSYFSIKLESKIRKIRFSNIYFTSELFNNPLIPVFDFTINSENSLPAPTNLTDYYVPKTVFLKDKLR